jgi:hypothetical protein
MSHPIQPQTIVHSGGGNGTDYVGSSRVFQCVVLSADDCRREMWAWSAADAGWAAQRGSDVLGVEDFLDRIRTQLIVVDLVGANASQTREYRSFLERNVGQPSVLIVVCGEESDWRQEVWVRQLGVWMYLAGELDTEGLATLCGEALQIADKLTASPRVSSVKPK